MHKIVNLFFIQSFKQIKKEERIKEKKRTFTASQRAESEEHKTGDEDAVRLHVWVCGRSMIRS